MYNEAPSFRPGPHERDTLHNKEAPYFRPSPPWLSTTRFNLHHPTAHVGPPLPPWQEQGQAWMIFCTQVLVAFWREWRTGGRPC